MRGFNGFMSEPQRNYRGVDTGLQQFHGSGVPQDVRCNVLALQGWASLAGDGRLLGQDILHSVRAEMPATSIGEQDLAVASGGLQQPGL